MRHTIQLLIEVETDGTREESRDALIRELSDWRAPDFPFSYVHDENGDPNEAIPIFLININHVDHDIKES